MNADGPVLTATRSMLTEHGFPALSVEAVAREANVSTGTIYRRWPSKTALAAAAYSDMVGPDEPVDTGSFRSDLQALVPSLHAFFTGEHGKLLASLVTSAGNDPVVAAALHDAAKPRRAGLRRIVRRAIDRGELPADTDPELLTDLVVGPLWTRLLVTGRPITRPLITRMVEVLATLAE